MKLTRLTLLTVIAAVLSITSILSHSPVFAGDELQNEAACQECLNSAESAWQECVEMAGGDEGDAACAAAKRDNVATCQRTVCID